MRYQGSGSRFTTVDTAVAEKRAHHKSLDKSVIGAWIADPYNRGASDPFEVVGGTSLSAPSWAGLVALVNQGRATGGQPSLNSTSPTEIHQDLYRLGQADYHVISSGTNGGYNAAPGYNLVTGLGTPIANLLVADLVAGNYPATGQVAPISPTLNANPGFGGTGGGTFNVMSVFNVRGPLSVVSGKGSRGGAENAEDVRGPLSVVSGGGLGVGETGLGLSMATAAIDYRGIFSWTDLVQDVGGGLFESETLRARAADETASDRVFADGDFGVRAEDSSPEQLFGDPLSLGDSILAYQTALRTALDDWGELRM